MTCPSTIARAQAVSVSSSVPAPDTEHEDSERYVTLGFDVPMHHPESAPPCWVYWLVVEPINPAMAEAFTISCASHATT